MQLSLGQPPTCLVLNEHCHLGPFTMAPSSQLHLPAQTDSSSASHCSLQISLRLQTRFGDGVHLYLPVPYTGFHLFLLDRPPSPLCGTVHLTSKRTEASELGTTFPTYLSGSWGRLQGENHNWGKTQLENREPDPYALLPAH